MTFSIENLIIRKIAHIEEAVKEKENSLKKQEEQFYE